MLAQVRLSRSAARRRGKQQAQQQQQRACHLISLTAQQQEGGEREVQQHGLTSLHSRTAEAESVRSRQAGGEEKQREGWGRVDGGEDALDAAVEAPYASAYAAVTAATPPPPAVAAAAGTGHEEEREKMETMNGFECTPATPTMCDAPERVAAADDEQTCCSDHDMVTKEGCMDGGKAHLQELRREKEGVQEEAKGGWNSHRKTSEVKGGEEASEVVERALDTAESWDGENERGTGKQMHDDACVDSGGEKRGEGEGKQGGGGIEGGGESCGGGGEMRGTEVIHDRPPPSVTHPEGFFLFTEKRAHERQAFDQQVGREAWYHASFM